jgi:hypothetical protein
MLAAAPADIGFAGGAAGFVGSDGVVAQPPATTPAASGSQMNFGISRMVHLSSIVMVE